MAYTFQTEQWVPYPVDVVFAFFANPENLPKLMPDWQKARIEAEKIVPVPFNGTNSISAAGAGSRITLSFLMVRGVPFRLKWEAEITEFSWEGRFCDRQLKGPFQSWLHCHQIRSVPGREFEVTLITDHVTYEVPFGWMGRLGHRLFIQRQIRQMFAERQSRVIEMLSANAAPSGPNTSL